LLLKLNQIIVPERARTVLLDSPEFQELQDSIQQHGLLVPITVRKTISPEETKDEGAFDRYYQLVCGGRRLCAFQHLLNETGEKKYQKILANVVKISSETEALVCELEENIRRTDFTWQERVLASGKIFEKLQRADSTFGIQEFSTLVNQALGKTSHDMDMYFHRFDHPTIFACDTWSRSREELRRLKVALLAEEKIKRQRAQKIPKSLQENSFKSPVEKMEGESSDHSCVNPNPSALELVFNSALHLLESLENNSVDIICTDPPFGIDIQGGRHRRTQKEIYKKTYKDTKEEYFSIIGPCLKQFARVLKPGAHLYMFFGIEYIKDLSELLRAEGFLVHKVPLIWHRTGTGAAANQPYYLPASAYQAILFAFAPGERRRLERQGQSNVITLPALSPQKKVHPLEVPTLVYADLISRSAHKGDLMIDPFCGTGNSLVGGLMSYCRVLGAEIRQDYRNLAVLNIEERLSWETKIEDSKRRKQ